MVSSFQCVYQDEYGEEVTSFQIDSFGHKFKVVLRGVEFTGDSFDRLSPSDAIEESVPFSLDEENYLHSFKIVCELPVLVVGKTKTSNGRLIIDCTVCSSEEEWEDASYLQFTLFFDDSKIKSDWCKTGFEDELTNLESKMPPDNYLKCCFNCQFASYNPYFNSGLMGELACFVNTEDKFARRGKGFRGWGKGEAVLVQELFVCPEFQPSQVILNKPWYFESSSNRK
jgi:hypothetical protein